MTNHVHLLLVPGRFQALSQMLRDTHTAYALRFNLQNGVSGHLWQGRFFSCVLDDSYVWAAVRYVEQNPVRAGLVTQAEAYPWSSAGAHCGLRLDPLLSSGFPPAGAVNQLGRVASRRRSGAKRRPSPTNPHRKALRISGVCRWSGREDESSAQSEEAWSQGSRSPLAFSASVSLAV